MDNKEETIYCSRCGAEMKASARYCMKCGNLNYDHPSNVSMKKLLKKDQVEASSYQVGSGKFILSDVASSSNTVVQSVANNTGSKALCFYLTFGVYLLIVLGNLGLTFANSDVSLKTLVNSSFPMIALSSSLIFLYLYSLELLFMKANKKWWSGLIPIYNIMILSEMAFNKKKLGLLSLVPFFGVLYIFVMFYKIGEKFKYSGLTTALFNIIMIPIIAFGDHPYDGRVFVDDSKNAIELEYTRKRSFLIVAILFFVIGLGLYLYANMTQVEATSKDAGNFYYFYASRKIVNKIKKAVDKGEISCKDGVSFDNTTGTYYLYIGDAGDEFNLFMQIMREPIEAYVKIENVNGAYKYYVSMTDGEKGFSETFSDNINVKTVVEYKKLSNDYKNGNSCYINS